MLLTENWTLKIDYQLGIWELDVRDLQINNLDWHWIPDECNFQSSNEKLITRAELHECVTNKHCYYSFIFSVKLTAVRKSY